MLKYLVIILISLVSLQVNGQVWSNPNPLLYGLQYQGFKAPKGFVFGSDTSRKEAGTMVIIGDTLYVANGTYYRNFGYAGIVGGAGTVTSIASGYGILGGPITSSGTLRIYT